MEIFIDHRTTYRYDADVVYSIQNIRLTPVENAGQRILSWSLRTNAGGPVSEMLDAYGNIVSTVTTLSPHRNLEIEVRGHVLTRDSNGVFSNGNERMPARVFLRRTALTCPDEALSALAAAFQEMANKDPMEAAHRLMNAIRMRIDYRTEVTDVKTTAAQALAHGYGVCQDYAHVFIACARELGLPARYISGYLWAGERGESYEASHAWAEVLMPDLGWVGFDVANEVCPTEAYVRVACGLDYADIPPVRGARLGEAKDELDVAVSVSQNAQQQ